MIDEYQFAIKNGRYTLNTCLTTGHELGSCYVSPDKHNVYVSIPKNASSSSKTFFKDWTFENFLNLKDKECQYLVILRDPTQRWFSGVAEFLVSGLRIADRQELETFLSNTYVKRWIFETVHLDNHTMPQSYYIQGLPVNQTVFFYQDSTVLERIADKLNYNSAFKIERNSTAQNDLKQTVVDWLKQCVESDSTLQKKIDVAFWSDHCLFDNVEFN